VRGTIQPYSACFSTRTIALAIFLVLAFAARETRAATAEKSGWQAQWDSAVGGGKVRPGESVEGRRQHREALHRGDAQVVAGVASIHIIPLFHNSGYLARARACAR